MQIFVKVPSEFLILVFAYFPVLMDKIIHIVMEPGFDEASCLHKIDGL